MAKITVIGNIGKDAQLRKVRNGDREDSVLSVWIAENIKHRNGTTEAQWSKVTIWRRYAETMAPLLTKGRRVLVEGIVTPKFYTNKANVLVPYLDIQAERITLLDSKREEEDVPPETEITPEIESETVDVAPAPAAPARRAKAPAQETKGTIAQTEDGEEIELPW